MASTASSSLSLLPLLRSHRRHAPHTRRYPAGKARERRRSVACAAQETGGAPPFQRRRGTPGVDTRIHWDNPDEGWLGVSSRPNKAEDEAKEEEVLGEKFADLLKNSTNSYYQFHRRFINKNNIFVSIKTKKHIKPLFPINIIRSTLKGFRTKDVRFLGVSAAADMEEIKAAYRRLSKEYHPDTTSLPLKVASDKFMQLREVYDVLSDVEKRRFYDWTLAQQAASREKERMKMRLADPYVQDVQNWESVPDTVDRLGGRNIKLSDQAMTALTVDAGIIVFAIACIVYVLFFKEA